MYPTAHSLLTALASVIMVVIAASQPGYAASKSESHGALEHLPEAHFPLRVSDNKEHLVDASGRPFLIHGDTAWSLIAQLKREDAEQYLEDRRTRGFNAILVNLLEHKFSSNAPANAYGEPPFLTPGDFTKPNEKYFTHADWILRRANEKGILVLLAPAYLGMGGGDEGWEKAMLANGTEALRTYGQFLGNRYSDLPNVLWVHGGDHSPPRKELVRAIAEGIRSIDSDALHTAHAAPGTAALEYWEGEDWLQVNNIYTYESVYRAALAQHLQASSMPFFLIESSYENEHGAGELQVRAQAYQALLSGAAGHIFGNNPIWHFDGPGLHSAPASWKASLNSRGAESMQHLIRLFSALPWWTITPDVDGTLLLRASLGGVGSDAVIAARAQGSSIAIVYLSQARPVALNLTHLSGPRLVAHWYDPANGQFTRASGAPPSPIGRHVFDPPSRNSSGHGDWVLLVQSGS